MTTFLLIRHATTDAVGRVLSGWVPDVHLNAAGMRQAVALAERLGAIKLAAVYTSPLERARETAAPLAARHALEPRVVPDGGEVRFGEWTGRRFTDLAHDPIWQSYNQVRSLTRVPGGEMAIEVQARIVALLERLRAEHAEGCVALVSHADVIKAALAYALGSPIDLMQRIEVQTASVSTLVLDQGSPRVLNVNVTGEIGGG
jgi:probable phosphoglycerate mutase